jgi:hypothetical protein
VLRLGLVLSDLEQLLVVRSFLFLKFQDLTRVSVVIWLMTWLCFIAVCKIDGGRHFEHVPVRVHIFHAKLVRLMNELLVLLFI